MLGNRKGGFGSQALTPILLGNQESYFDLTAFIDGPWQQPAAANELLGLLVDSCPYAQLGVIGMTGFNQSIFKLPPPHAVSLSQFGSLSWAPYGIAKPPKRSNMDQVTRRERKTCPGGLLSPAWRKRPLKIFSHPQKSALEESAPGIFAFTMDAFSVAS